MVDKLHGPGPEIADSGEEYIAPVTRKQQKDPFIRHLDQISGQADKITYVDEDEEIDEEMYGLQKQLIPHPATDAEFTSGRKDWGPRSRSIQAFGGSPTVTPDTNDDKFGPEFESLQTVGQARGNYRGFAGVPPKGSSNGEKDQLWFPQQSEPANVKTTPGDAVDTIRRKVLLRLQAEAADDPAVKVKKASDAPHPADKKAAPDKRTSVKKIHSLQPSQKRQTDRPDLDQRFKGVLKYADIVNARLATEKMNEFWKEYIGRGDRGALRRLKSLAVVAQNRAQFRFRDEGHTKSKAIYLHYDAWLKEHPMPHEIIEPTDSEKSAIVRWRIKYRANGWHKDTAEIEAVQYKTAITRLKKELGEKFDDFKIIGSV